MKLLVVVDDPPLQTALLRLLAQWGYGCELTTKAAEALAWLEREPFDPELLRVRLRALLRLAQRPLQHELSHGPLQLVAGQTNVLVQGEALELTRKEALLLEQLLRAGGDSLSKRQLWQRWPGGVSLWQPVDSQAERLGYVRVALSDRAAQADLIRLQRGLLLGGIVTVLAALLVGRRMVRLAFLPLQHKVSALQRFTADASHELRHPLTALRAQLAAVPTELRQQPAMAWSELDGLSPRLGDLLDDLLLLARQEQAGLDGPLASAELQAFDLLELLEDLLRCYTPQAAARDIQLELSPDPTCHSVPCPTQDRERVFERFWSGADRGGHSGLGLAIGRAIARRHSSELRLGESRAGRCELVVALPAMDGR